MPETQQPINTLIVEDEPHMRAYLRELLESEKEIALVGEASTGVEGVEQIRRLSPDLVFLDVQMPELDGFGLIQKLGSKRMPAFVFVTAYADYAIRAFEVEAVDYLCKPFDRDRLQASLERVMRHLRMRNRPAAATRSGSTEAGLPWISRVAISEESGIIFVPVDRILWIEAANKYVVVHTVGQSHIARQTIQNLEAVLDPKLFVRIHRSILVRKAAVRGLHPLFHGDYIVKLNNGVELRLSRNFRESFFRQMSR